MPGRVIVERGEDPVAELFVERAGLTAALDRVTLGRLNEPRAAAMAARRCRDPEKKLVGILTEYAGTSKPMLNVLEMCELDIRIAYHSMMICCYQQGNIYSENREIFE